MRAPLVVLLLLGNLLQRTDGLYETCRNSSDIGTLDLTTSTSKATMCLVSWKTPAFHCTSLMIHSNIRSLTSYPLS